MEIIVREYRLNTLLFRPLVAFCAEHFWKTLLYNLLSKEQKNVFNVKSIGGGFLMKKTVMHLTHQRFFRKILLKENMARSAAHLEWAISQLSQHAMVKLVATTLQKSDT